MILGAGAGGDAAKDDAGAPDAEAAPSAPRGALDARAQSLRDGAHDRRTRACTAQEEGCARNALASALASAEP